MKGVEVTIAAAPARPLVAGIDEVGRGCLAGPVYAAAVILPERCRLPGLNDSKKLSADQRSRLAPLIEARAIAWAVGIASVEEIESFNILRASLLAMQRAVAALSVAPQRAQVDGNQPPQLPCPVETIIEGDAKVRAIMAASVVAKVARDTRMRELDGQYPGYGFAQHKGYATDEHRAALDKLGPCPLHRKTFMPVALMQHALDLGEL